MGLKSKIAKVTNLHSVQIYNLYDLLSALGKLYKLRVAIIFSNLHVY